MLCTQGTKHATRTWLGHGSGGFLAAACCLAFSHSSPGIRKTTCLHTEKGMSVSGHSVNFMAFASSLSLILPPSSILPGPACTPSLLAPCLPPQHHCLWNWQAGAGRHTASSLLLLHSLLKHARCLLLLSSPLSSLSQALPAASVSLSSSPLSTPTSLHCTFLPACHHKHSSSASHHTLYSSIRHVTTHSIYIN